jgi:GNAT superfamily N-acetyltransferase
MPRIRRKGIPPRLMAHLIKRVRERDISTSQLGLLSRWLDTEPEVPDGKWFKRLPEMIVCGEGEWSRGDASDIDGTGREAEVSGSERVNW